MRRQTHIKFIVLSWLLACSWVAHTASHKSVIRDATAAEALLGQHRFSLQWISRQTFGEVTITDDKGVLRLRGHQTDHGVGNVLKARSAMTIDGMVTLIDTTSFQFQGTLIIRLGYGPVKEPCVRRGTFTFAYREGKSRSWRLLEKQNPCVDHIDYVDIYVDRQWRPAIARPREPTEAERWGIGLITTEPNLSDGPGLAIFPAMPIPLYARPHGRQVSQAYRAKDQWNIVIEQVGAGAITRAHSDDLREVGYESGAVIVFAVQDEFLKVFNRSANQGVWIHTQDLAPYGFRFVSWLDFLRGKSDGGLFPRSSMGLNLRSGPGPMHARLATLRGDLIDITPTGQKQGLWLEVRTVRYDIHPCADGKGHIIERWHGWLKAVDEKGFPNLWYATRGC